MSAESELYTLLTGAAGVTAIVDSRIYPDQVPQDQQVPAIAFQRAATEYLNTLHATAPLGSTVTMEVTCVSASRAAAITLANAVVAAFAGSEFFAVDQQAAADIDNELWGAIVSVNFNE